MKCSFCDSERTQVIKGPRELSICQECVKSLSPENESPVEGKCSFCGATIGRKKGLFKRRRVKAVAVESDKGVIICNFCLELMADILREEEGEQQLLTRKK
jgi:ATP-dependent protease Clp ATPase subunit